MGFIGNKSSSTTGKTTPFSLADSLPVQTKLTVSKASDPAEKEADTLAKKVVDEQKDKKTAATKEDKKEPTRPPDPTTDPVSEPKKEGVQAKDDDKKDVQKKEGGEEKEKPRVSKKDEAGGEKKEPVSKKDDEKKEVQKKSSGEEKEKKVGRKDEGGEKKEPVSKMDDKKDVKKKEGAEEKEKPKASKKDETGGEKKEPLSRMGDDKKDVKKKNGAEEKEKPKVAKKDDQKKEVQKKNGAEEKEKPKVAKKDEDNREKKPVEKEKDSSVKPRSIQRKESNEKKDKPQVQQKPRNISRQGQNENKEANKPEDENADEEKLNAIENKINAKRGSGRKLDPQVKAEMENSFSEDFTDVHIHDDKESAELCAALNAQAFAIGKDIFFNNGKYDPGTEAGKELLAHELTHVVQQKETVQRMVIHRNPGTSTNSKGSMSDTEITINELQLPTFKSRNKGKFQGTPIKRPKGYERDAGLKQDEKWKEDVKPKVEAKVKDMVAGASIDADTKCYYFGLGKIKLFGTEQKMAENSLVPLWNKSGSANAYDVDHIKEMQLGGTNDPPNNMELLQFSANRSSGSLIKTGIRQSVEEFITEEKKDPAKKPPTVDAALKKYDITFNNVKFSVGGGAGNSSDYWSYEDITKGEHLSNFKPLSAKEIEQVKGSPSDPIVYTSEAGGSGLRKGDFSNLPGFKLNTFDFSSPASEVTGKVTGVILPNSKIVKPYTLNLNAYKMDGVLNGGYIKRRVSGEGSLEKILSRMEIDGLSPVEFQTADLIPGKGLYAKGKIKSTVKLIENLDIDITIMGDDIEISKTFGSGEITSVPPPFKINDASVTIFAGTAGIGVRGGVDFEVTNVGKGQVKGSGKSSGVFELEGKFEFDKKVFDRADVEMKYRHASGEEDQWEVKGTIQIPKGKIKGVKKADVKVSYDGTTLAATGTAEFDIPGIKSGKLDVTYTEDQLNILGEVDLQHQLIKSGKIKANVSKTGEEYKVALSGNVQPNIPGISTDLAVDYTDGILTISGTVGYTKGRLSGTVTVGVTNRSVGADGNPAGGPSETLTPFGGGSLTLRITDWLQGTAGVKLLPDGSLEVVGKIGIPAAVNIFEKKEIKKEIFKAPTIEIPLFAIPVGSRSIGLVATIGGGLEGYASIGPGQLTDAAVEVTYNPSHEENTKVSGTAKFRVPAEAGLRLYVRAGIGLSVGIARVAGGIEIGGALGIEGAAEAGVNVNWTPAEGFKLDAEASLSVQPKFKFDINAYVEAVLDLWVTEFSKEWKWNLYSFEWGPSFRFGVKFPVHYEEGKEFNISLDDVQFEKPDISVTDIAKGIGEKLF